MQTFSHSLADSVWRVRLVTFVLAALAAFSASYWVLKWQDTPRLTYTPVTPATAHSIDTAELSFLLGGSGNSAQASSKPVRTGPDKYKLLGVIAQGNHGRALISIDGTPAKPYQVGQTLSDGLVLHSVSARSAALAAGVQNTPTVQLELPLLGGSKIK